MEQFTLAISDRLIARGVLDENDRDICRYGLEVLFEMLLTSASIIVLAWLGGNVLETLVFLCSFMVLRTYTGGYHASTRVRCYLLSLAMYGIFCFLLWTPEDWRNILSVVGTIFSVSFVWLFAPVVHPNRSITSQEEKHYRQYSRIIVIIEALVVLGGKCFFLGGNLTDAIALGLVAVSFSMAMMRVCLIVSM